MANRICTVGHSMREFGEMVQMLRRNEITCLVDVRSFRRPGSTRNGTSRRLWMPFLLISGTGGSGNWAVDGIPPRTFRA